MLVEVTLTTFCFKAFPTMFTCEMGKGGQNHHRMRKREDRKWTGNIPVKQKTKINNSNFTFQ